MRTLFMALAFTGLLAAAPKTWDNVGRLKPGAAVEVITADHAERGEFVASSTESLTIRTKTGERKFTRMEVMRVVSRGQSRRLRNALIGAGVGAALGLVTDQTLGTYLRNESNPSGARALIWTIPIAAGTGIGAAFPSYPVVYKK
jgi:hypothetical protein